ncbi:MAG: endolytic transglycosylase MltG [Lachnospiraceae bacterium]|nr:endolytic transglycosylase MltG [Lachnospiraceae bacterium]
MKKVKGMPAGFGTIVRVALVLIALLLIYSGATKCYDFGYRVFMEPAMTEGEGRKVTVEIAPGMKPKEIGELFVEKGLVRDAGLFAAQYRLSEYVKEVKAGTFELSTSMTAEEMMRVMAGYEIETEE